MNFDKLLFRVLFFSIVNSICFFSLDWISITFSFYQVYFLFLSIYFVTVLLERKLVGKDFFIQLPIGNFIFAFIAFYLPLPFIYENIVLKALSQWQSDYLIYKSLLITNVGLHCILIGYNLIRTLKSKKLTEVTFKIKINKIYFLFLVYFISVFILISTGNYGITEQLENSARGYVTILTSLAQFGSFGLIFLVYYYYEKKALLILITLLFFLIGLLSGMKENAILPLVIVGITYYFKNGTVPVKFVIPAMVMVYLTFIIVTSFRNAYLRNGRQELSSLSSLTLTYLKSAKEGTNKKYNYYELTTAQSLMYRLNYTSSIAKVITYTDKNGFGLPYDSHPAHILGSPFYSFIPRFIFTFKPESNFGGYVSSEVYGLGKKVTYAIGISQSGYAYLWKGMFGVIVLMLFVGIFQGFFYNLFFKTITPIYIYLFISNIYVGDAIWTYTTTFFRFSLILLAFYYLFGSRVRTYNKIETNPCAV